ncbi:unnamed protein product [Linum trigynum]|uniref:Uncharacterized protein n=1 Tax=Linum trigynum TaxID=586398 RepID=A0AAV2GKD6_9ROSI
METSSSIADISFFGHSVASFVFPFIAGTSYVGDGFLRRHRDKLDPATLVHSSVSPSSPPISAVAPLPGSISSRDSALSKHCSSGQPSPLPAPYFFFLREEPFSASTAGEASPTITVVSLSVSASLPRSTPA